MKFSLHLKPTHVLLHSANTSSQSNLIQTNNFQKPSNIRYLHDTQYIAPKPLRDKHAAVYTLREHVFTARSVVLGKCATFACVHVCCSRDTTCTYKISWPCVNWKHYSRKHVRYFNFFQTRQHQGASVSPKKRPWSLICDFISSGKFSVMDEQIKKIQCMKRNMKIQPFTESSIW